MLGSVKGDVRGPLGAIDIIDSWCVDILSFFGGPLGIRWESIGGLFL